MNNRAYKAPQITVSSFLQTGGGASASSSSSSSLSTSKEPEALAGGVGVVEPTQGYHCHGTGDGRYCHSHDGGAMNHNHWPQIEGIDSLNGQKDALSKSSFLDTGLTAGDTESTSANTS